MYMYFKAMSILTKLEESNQSTEVGKFKTEPLHIYANWGR